MDKQTKDDFTTWLIITAYLFGARKYGRLGSVGRIDTLDQISGGVKYRFFLQNGRLDLWFHHDYDYQFTSKIIDYDPADGKRYEQLVKEMIADMSGMMKKAFRSSICINKYCICDLSFEDGCNGRCVFLRNEQTTCDLCKKIEKRSPDGDPDKLNSFAYIAGNTKGKLYKIGCSNRPNTRVKTVETSVPFDVELIHVIATNRKYSAESLLHRFFRESRLGGEWFVLKDNDISFLKSIKSVKFSKKDTALSVDYENDDDFKDRIAEFKEALKFKEVLWS